jgi:hypothetical protein
VAAIGATRAVGVDWSGARDAGAQRRTIWVAVVEGGELVGLSAGRTREETLAHLEVVAARPAPDGREVATLIGLDFSFGFPGWFAREHGCDDGPASWRVAAGRGEEWLATCPAPFFGAGGTRRPPGVELFRATERRVATEARLYPKSIFQLAGPGAVGPGSLRGMPLLTRLRSSGWAVWPFDAPGHRTVAEVYPALAVGRRDLASVVTPDGRARFVDSIRPGTAGRFPDLVRSRDAFDAAAAAFLLAGAAGAPAAGPGSADRGLEGEIWVPAPVPANGSGAPSPRS